MHEKPDHEGHKVEYRHCVERLQDGAGMNISGDEVSRRRSQDGGYDLPRGQEVQDTLRRRAAGRSANYMTPCRESCLEFVERDDPISTSSSWLLAIQIDRVTPSRLTEGGEIQTNGGANLRRWQRTSFLAGSEGCLDVLPELPGGLANE